MRSLETALLATALSLQSCDPKPTPIQRDSQIAPIASPDTQTGSTNEKNGVDVGKGLHIGPQQYGSSCLRGIGDTYDLCLKIKRDVQNSVFGQNAPPNDMKITPYCNGLSAYALKSIEESARCDEAVMEIVQNCETEGKKENLEFLVELRSLRDRLADVVATAIDDRFRERCKGDFKFKGGKNYADEMANLVGAFNEKEEKVKAGLKGAKVKTLKKYKN